MTILSTSCNKIYRNVVPHDDYKKYNLNTEFSAISNLVCPRTHMAQNLLLLALLNLTNVLIQNRTQDHENY